MPESSPRDLTLRSLRAGAPADRLLLGGLELTPPRCRGSYAEAARPPGTTAAADRFEACVGEPSVWLLAASALTDRSTGKALALFAPLLLIVGAFSNRAAARCHPKGGAG